MHVTQKPFQTVFGLTGSVCATGILRLTPTRARTFLRLTCVLFLCLHLKRTSHFSPTPTPLHHHHQLWHNPQSSEEIAKSSTSNISVYRQEREFSKYRRHASTVGLAFWFYSDSSLGTSKPETLISNYVRSCCHSSCSVPSVRFALPAIVQFTTPFH